MPVKPISESPGSTKQEPGNLPEIEKWKSLNEIINKPDAFDENLDDLSKCYDYVPILKIAETLQSEEEYRTYIFNILNTIFNDKLFENKMKSLEFRYQDRKKDTDLFLIDSGNQDKRCINIEIKRENVLLCLKQFDLYEYYCNYCKTKNQEKPPCINPINCIKQVYRYMKNLDVKYAVLTTFNRTWFFKLENNKLYVSKKIDYDLFLKAMYWLVKISTEKSSESFKRKIVDVKEKNVKISNDFFL